MIRLNGIALKYGSGHEVLREVTFHLRPGSFHFLTGPSGSGKTSLLRLLFMSILATRGQIHVLGNVPITEVFEVIQDNRCPKNFRQIVERVRRIGRRRPHQRAP